MPGDISRSTFKPANRYCGVRHQQGRVLLDSDWNEQVDIQTYHLHTEAVDVIGPCGAPRDNAGLTCRSATVAT